MDSGADDGECLGCVGSAHIIAEHACMPHVDHCSLSKRYAETMDDEPEEMNDTALRSVVRCAFTSLVLCLKLTHPDIQFLRHRILAAAARRNHASIRRQSAHPGTANEQQIRAGFVLNYHHTTRMLLHLTLQLFFQAPSL